MKLSATSLYGNILIKLCGSTCNGDRSRFSFYYHNSSEMKRTKNMLQFSWNAYGWDDITGNNVLLANTTPPNEISLELNANEITRKCNSLITTFRRSVCATWFVLFHWCRFNKNVQANEIRINHRIYEFGIKQTKRTKMTKKKTTTCTHRFCAQRSVEHA